MTNTIVMTAMIACLLNGLAAYVETIRFATLPSLVLAGHARPLPPNLISRIRHFLIALDADGGDRSMRAAWGDDDRHGAAAASDDDHRVVRELLAGPVISGMGKR